MHGSRLFNQTWILNFSKKCFPGSYNWDKKESAYVFSYITSVSLFCQDQLELTIFLKSVPFSLVLSLPQDLVTMIKSRLSKIWPQTTFPVLILPLTFTYLLLYQMMPLSCELALSFMAQCCWCYLVWVTLFHFTSSWLNPIQWVESLSSIYPL